MTRAAKLVRAPSELRSKILQLREDEPVDSPGVWYRTQKEHWLGWLKYYDSPGAYGRKVTSGRDARFVYNHVVNPQMLFWLVESSGVDSALVAAAGRYVEAGPSMMARSGWIRRHVSWDLVETALWPPRRNLLRRLKGS